MPVISNKIRHPRQLPFMAKALGVNLEEAVSVKRIANFQRHNIANRCSDCTEKSACDTWLATNGAGVAEAPDYCPNKALLEELQK